jgi:hypothetical protein
MLTGTRALVYCYQQSATQTYRYQHHDRLETSNIASYPNDMRATLVSMSIILPQENLHGVKSDHIHRNRGSMLRQKPEVSTAHLDYRL